MTKSPAKIDFSKKFIKQLKKSPLEIKIAFRKRLENFLQNEFHPLFNNHVLKGEYSGLRSINITGDWRALYSKDKDRIIFELLGTHSELYE